MQISCDKKYNILRSFLKKINKISHRSLPQLGWFNFASSQVVNKWRKNSLTACQTIFELLPNCQFSCVYWGSRGALCVHRCTLVWHSFCAVRRQTFPVNHAFSWRFLPLIISLALRVGVCLKDKTNSSYDYCFFKPEQHFARNANLRCSRLCCF